MSHNSPWHKQIADDHRILLTEVGSGLHGVNIPGTDDHDEMGICIPPPETVIGLASFEQYTDRWHADGTRIPEGERSGFGDTDHTVYSLAKWARLAADGNPTVLMPIFAPGDKIYTLTEAGRSLLENRDLFLSKQAGARFLGYLNSQSERARGLRGRKHTNRPELIEKFGYDTKMMYHALRLAHQGRELIQTGRITLPMDPSWVAYLRAVRGGEYDLGECLDALDHYKDQLVTATNESDLPVEPDAEAINNWLIGQHYNHWIKNGLL